MKSLRQRKGLTQAQIAGKVFVSDKNYGKYERGNTEPPFDVIIGLAKLYGVTTDFILLGETAKVDDDIGKALERCNTEQRAEILNLAKFFVKENEGE